MHLQDFTKHLNMKKYICVILFLVCALIQGQNYNTRADRYFKQGDYLSAIDAYKAEKTNKKRRKHVVKQLATCYYNTFQYRKAFRFLKTISKWDLPTEDQHFYFKTYQVLSAIGAYEKALPYLEKYQKFSKGEPINIDEAKSIIEKFKLKDNDYVIKEADFNSEAADFGATFIDGEVYFTSDRSSNGILQKDYKWTHRPYLDIFKVPVDKAYRKEEDATALQSPLNSKWHEGNFCFTKDRKTVYISKNNIDKGKKKYDSLRNNAIHLYKSVKKDSTWGALEKLPFNNVNYSIEHPALNKTEDTLFFASNKKGGYGGFDLYAIAIKSDSIYGEPINLGAKINTKHREQFPYVSPKGDLFFASDGHLGLGMLDLFVSKKVNGEYEDPINLGAPINSSFDDFSLNYHNENSGFFTSNRKRVNDDIYSFQQVGEIFPKPYNSIFEVRDYLTQDIIPEATVRITDNLENVLLAKTLDKTSSIAIPLMPEGYTFYASAIGYNDKEKNIYIREREGETYTIYLEKNESYEKIKKIEKEIEKEVASRYDCPEIKDQSTLKKQLLSDKVGPPVVEKNGKLYFELPPIYFDYDKWNIRKDSRLVLDQLAEKLEKYKTVHIQINSHTDNRGSNDYNQILSEKRAESTRNYLALVGYINARRLRFRGYGESQLIIDCNNCSEAQHQTNRRSEFEIIKY